MFSIALSFALIPYGIIVILFVLLAAYSIFSMLHHGATTGASFLATFAFLAGATFVLFFTHQALRGTDWSQRMEFNPSVQSLTESPASL